LVGILINIDWSIWILIDGVALHKNSGSWEFASEAALEKFFWANLQDIFDFTPLKQQYASGGEICDILAIGKSRELVILELKNTEDRYLIQQLTRYCANLLEERPFSQEIDYSQPVRLIGIAPSYHRHNLIDRDHSRLSFELLEFSVIEDNSTFFFVLNQTGGEASSERIFIPYQPIEAPSCDEIDAPPELLIKWLGGCTTSEQEEFLQMRHKILACNRRMKEMVDRRSIRYGSGKTRLCAEILFQQKSQKPVLFLWLPTPNTFLWSGSKKVVVGRLRTWTDGETISHVGHVPKGFGKMRTKSEWEQVPPEKRPHMMSSLSSKSRTPVESEGYLRRLGISDRELFWVALTDLAIEKWLEKS
jgi:RecB family endonuclease NucS